MPIAVYNPQTNQVQTFIADDSSYTPETPYKLVNANALPNGWTLEKEKAPRRRGVSAIVADMTAAEKLKLKNLVASADDRINFMLVMLAAKMIDTRDPDILDGMKILVNQNVITEARRKELAGE